MDALALLCNLYGDGPATLKRLRSAGLSTVESLDEVEAPGLADTLETTEAAARRFLREARLLGERMVEGGFEEEAQPPIATHGAGPVPILELQEERVFAEPAAPEPRSDDAWAATGVLLSAGSPAGVDQADEPGEPDALPGDDAEGELDIDIEDANEVFDLELDLDDDEPDTAAGHDSLVEEVLTTWRERDILVRGDWGATGTELSEDEDALESAGSPLDATGQASAGTPLELRLLDGLSGEWCERFQSLGMRTVEALAEMDTLRAAEELGEGLTRLDRFRFLARRHLLAAELEAAPTAVLRSQGKESRPGTLVPHAGPGEAAAGAAAGAPAPTRRYEELGEAKFSLSEAPYGVATSPLARDLDKAAPRPGPDAGSAGPFG